MAYLIETSNLTKHFTLKGKICKAVSDVNIKVDEGELLGLLGPNGAGKTTLIKMLCTLILPTRGNAMIGGRDIVKDEKIVRNSIGLINGGERSFYWRLTGRENLEFFASLYNLTVIETKKRVNEIVGLLEMKSIIDQPFQSYSTGMKQRMSIARGLLPDPPVLFIDDLSKNLDPNVAETLRLFIKKKLVEERGKTIVLATHDIEEAELICDRIVIMNKGRICKTGTVWELNQKGRISLREAFSKIILENKGSE